MWRMLFMTIVITFTMVTSVYGKGTNELEEMADFVTNQNIDLKEWQIVMKEKMDIATINEILDDLKNSYNGTRTETENLLKYGFEDGQKGKNYNVIYIINLPKDNLTYPELTVVIEGKVWHQDVKTNLHTDIHSISSKYFTDNKQKFSWLKTEASDIINNGVFKEKLLEHLEIKDTKTQYDNTINSERMYIYGFTEKWNEKIIMDNRPINVQIAITSNKNGQPEMTLGTPILITEY